MKKYLSRLTLLLLFLPLSGAAQPPVSLPPDAAQFWNRFQDAVGRDDRIAVAALTRFPFNGGDRDAFLKNYDEVFTPKTRTCLRQSKPQPDQGFFTVVCGGNAYLFGQDQGRYSFSSIESRD